jgi:hypothetical protein
MVSFKQQQQDQQQQQQMVQAYQDFLMAYGVDRSSLAGNALAGNGLAGDALAGNSSLLAAGLGVDQQTLQQLTAQLLGGTSVLQPDAAGVQTDLAAGVYGPGFGSGPSDQGLSGSPQAMMRGLGPPGLDNASLFAAAGVLWFTARLFTTVA